MLRIGENKWKKSSTIYENQLSNWHIIWKHKNELLPEDKNKFKNNWKTYIYNGVFKFPNKHKRNYLKITDINTWISY